MSFSLIQELQMKNPTISIYGRVHCRLKNGFRSFPADADLPSLTLISANTPVSIKLLSQTEIEADCKHEIIASVLHCVWGDDEKIAVSELRRILLNAIDNAIQRLRLSLADSELQVSKELKDISFFYSIDCETYCGLPLKN